jgi:hypothetical protein
MLYDLSGGVVLKVSSELEAESSNLFVKRHSSDKIKALIECDFVSPDVVNVRYKEASFKYQHNNWIAQLFQLLSTVYVETFPQFIFLHGSCFCFNDNIVLLLGHSRSGKSTALYNLLCNNAIRYVSDEIIAIEPNEKYILPLSNKPIQLREDVVSINNYTLVDDAWNMSKVAYVCPKTKETNYLFFNNHRLTCCFIKYYENCKFQANSISGYDLLNSLFHCCFNISKASRNILANIAIKNIRAINVRYDGNIEKLFEVVS